MSATRSVWDAERTQKQLLMSRCVFVVDFCLSEEDKTTDTSIEFWFRCCNLDNDGVITQFEMEHFYREQLYRMHCLNVEAVPITDLLCQLYACKHARYPYSPQVDHTAILTTQRNLYAGLRVDRMPLTSASLVP